MNAFLIPVLCSIRFPYWAGGLSRSYIGHGRNLHLIPNYRTRRHGLSRLFRFRRTCPAFFCLGKTPPQNLSEINEANPPESWKLTESLGRKCLFPTALPSQSYQDSIFSGLCLYGRSASPRVVPEDKTASGTLPWEIPALPVFIAVQSPLIRGSPVSGSSPCPLR